MGLLAGVPDLAPSIWGLSSCGENQEIIAKGNHVKTKYLNLQVGVGRGIELPCLFISLLCWLMGVTLIWQTTPHKQLSPSILFTTIANSPNSQFPTHSASAVSYNHDQHIHCPSIQSQSPMPSASSSFPLVFSHPTPSIPITLVLNSPCVPLTLRRVWGWSQPPVPLNGFFLNVHTLWPSALYSNCVNKTSNGEGHRRHRGIP